MVATHEANQPPVPGSWQWTAVVPVKDLAVAKSRLPYPQTVRAALALAMARDVVAAVLATPGIARVLVVTDDAAAAGVLALDAVVIPDEPKAGLSAALAHGARVAATRWPDDGVLAIAADLPALTPAALAAMLAEVANQPARFLVADAAGSGTSLLAAPPGIALDPQFEGGSRAAHLAAGARDLTEYAHPGLRRDVDTPDDVVAVLALGAGPATLRACHEHGLAS